MSVDVAKNENLQNYRLVDLIVKSTFADLSNLEIGNRSQQQNESLKQKHKKHENPRHLHCSKLEDLLLAETGVNLDKGSCTDITPRDVNNNKSSGDYNYQNKDELIPIDDMPDFTWLTKDFKFTDITNTFGAEGNVAESFSAVADKEPGLSQRKELSKHSLALYDTEKCIQDDRLAIEQEIQDKYAEIDVLICKIKAKRQRSRRRRKYQLRKYDNINMDDSEEWLSPYVNICPIKRSKRCAQPIRNAVLVRSAMRKACKGLLGSCCGKGCWASWKWVNLRGVISDYE